MLMLMTMIMMMTITFHDEPLGKCDLIDWCEKMIEIYSPCIIKIVDKTGELYSLDCFRSLSKGDSLSSLILRVNPFPVSIGFYERGLDESPQAGVI